MADQGIRSGGRRNRKSQMAQRYKPTSDTTIPVTPLSDTSPILATCRVSLTPEGRLVARNCRAREGQPLRKLRSPPTKSHRPTKKKGNQTGKGSAASCGIQRLLFKGHA